MEKLALPAKIRSTTGKGAAKKLRDQGFLPAVLYGGEEQKAIPITINDHDVRVLLKQHAGQNTLITLMIEKEGVTEEHLALIQEFQKHPYKNKIWHIDFKGVSLNIAVKVEIPIIFTGEATGTDTLETHIRKIEVECLPDQIPNAIEIDISALQTDKPLTIGDLTVPENVKVLGNPKTIVAVVIETSSSEGETEEAEETPQTSTESSQE